MRWERPERPSTLPRHGRELHGVYTGKEKGGFEVNPPELAPAHSILEFE